MYWRINIPDVLHITKVSTYTVFGYLIFTQCTFYSNILLSKVKVIWKLFIKPTQLYNKKD